MSASRLLLTELIMRGVIVLLAAQNAWAEPPAGLAWELVFRDEFNGTTADLDKNWEFQDGPSSHILCSRWRDNVVAADGQCRLLNKKEQRGGQEWTSGSMWTKRQFRYGYFECRYKYGATTGLNNSFWLMTQGKERPATPLRFEIDVNEGHYPNEIATNIHRWSGVHTSASRSFRLGRQAGQAFPLEPPIETQGAEWVDPIGDFVLQYWDGHDWSNISQAESSGSVDLSREFHVYGLEWNERELVFYFDGKPLRREPNVFCHGEAPVWLSSAIIKWAGPVTDQIDGTSMVVDWVRVHQRKP